MYNCSSRLTSWSTYEIQSPSHLDRNYIFHIRFRKSTTRAAGALWANYGNGMSMNMHISSTIIFEGCKSRPVRTARPPRGMRAYGRIDSVWDSIMVVINYFSSCRSAACDAFYIGVTHRHAILYTASCWVM